MLTAAGALEARPARPAFAPLDARFTRAEKTRFEDAQRARRQRWLLIAGGTAVVALLATGATLLALGLSDDGSGAMTTGGVSALGAATAGGFIGLELMEW